MLSTYSKFRCSCCCVEEEFLNTTANKMDLRPSRYVLLFMILCWLFGDKDIFITVESRLKFIWRSQINKLLLKDSLWTSLRFHHSSVFLLSGFVLFFVSGRISEWPKSTRGLLGMSAFPPPLPNPPPPPRKSFEMCSSDLLLLCSGVNFKNC